MLAEAEAQTQQVKEELESLEGVKMIAPTILRECHNKQRTHPCHELAKSPCFNNH